MLREVHRFFTALVIKESKAAIFAGQQMNNLQCKLTENEKYFSNFIVRHNKVLPQETQELNAAAKDDLAAAEALVAQASERKFVRCWRLLEAYDLAVAGQNKQNRAFWTCFIADQDNME